MLKKLSRFNEKWILRWINEEGIKDMSHEMVQLPPTLPLERYKTCCLSLLNRYAIKGKRGKS